jgi:phospholipase A1
MFLSFLVSIGVVMNCFAKKANADDTTSIVHELRGEESPDFKRSENSDLSNILRHRPIYVLAGKPDTKVEISFKLRLVQKVDLFLGYSQMMFWQLTDESSPFRDVSYNPELFYRLKVDQGFWDALDIGIEHQSNGKDGDASRSFDRAYVQFNTIFGLGNRKVTWDTRFFAFYDKDETNKDISDYMSFWNTKLALTDVFGGVLEKGEAYVMFFPGGMYSNKWDRGGTEVGLKFRFKTFGAIPYFFIQGYSGYSESLLNYNEYVKSYRAGFLF